MVLNAVDDIGDNDLGFYEVIVNTKTFGALAVALLAQCSKHNNFDICGLGRVAENIENIKPADLWHHYVEQYQIGFITNCGSKRILTISDTLNVESFGLQTNKIYTGERIIVFYKENTFGMLARGQGLWF